MDRKDNEFRMELNGRLRTLEDRLTQENESIEGTYKGKCWRKMDLDKWIGKIGQMRFNVKIATKI